MDWNAGDFCVVKLSSQTDFYSNAKILEVFPSRRKARVTDITYGDIEEVSIEDLKPFQEFGASKEGFLEHKSIRSEAFGRPAGWREGDVCTARWEEDGRWYRARILKIFDSNEILVYFEDYGNADFTCLQNILSHDFTVICGEKEWKVSSVIISTRSPFFKAAISNNMDEKLEMKLEINDLDSGAVQEVLNYMHSVPIKSEESLFPALLEASERFQMSDLKEEVIEIGRKHITEENAVEIGKLAELYGIDSLLEKCIEFIAENGVKIEKVNVAPKLTLGVLCLREDELNLLKSMRIFRRKILKNRNPVQLANEELENLFHCMNYDLWDLIKKRKQLKMEKDLIKKRKPLKMEKDQFIMELEHHQIFQRLNNVKVEKDKLKKELLSFKVEICSVLRKRDALLWQQLICIENLRLNADLTSSREEAKDESDDNSDDNSDIEQPKAKRRKTANRHTSDVRTNPEVGVTTAPEGFNDLSNYDVQAEQDYSDDGNSDSCFSPEGSSDAHSDGPVFSEDEEDEGGPLFAEDGDENDPVFSEDDEDNDECHLKH